MMTLARLAPPTNRSAAARTLKVSTRSHRVPIALTRRTSILRMPPSKRKAGSERTIMRTGLASPAGAPPGCQPRAPAAHACGTSPSRAVRGFVERACARAVDDAPPQPPMLEVADHGRVVVVRTMTPRLPVKLSRPMPRPRLPGKSSRRREIETWSARNLSRFINICLFGNLRGCAYLLHNSTRTAPQAGLEDTD